MCSAGSSCDRQCHGTRSTSRAASGVDKHALGAYLKLHVCSALLKLYCLSSVQCFSAQKCFAIVYFLESPLRRKEFDICIFKILSTLSHLSDLQEVWIMMGEESAMCSSILKSEQIRKKQIQNMKEEAFLHFVWYNKNSDSVENNKVEYLRTKTVWPVVCLSKFLGIVLIFRDFTLLNWLFICMLLKKFLGRPCASWVRITYCHRLFCIRF